MRKYIAYAPDLFATHGAKTAHGVIAYSIDETVVVVDPANAGKSVRDVLPYLGSAAPIVATIDEALAYGATSLLVGVAPPGGQLPERWRGDILRALAAGLDVVNGLHETFNDDPELVAVAREANATMWDVRVPPAVPLFSGAAYELAARIVLTVGSDCAVGKMTASLELMQAARARGERAVFVPTGQTGIMIAGWGIAVDRVISDFTPGAAEQLVLEGARLGDLLFVEGQGAINHPAYGAVTLGLLLGSAADALVLVHDVNRQSMANFNTPLLPLQRLIRLYEELADSVKPAPLIGIVLNTRGRSAEEAQGFIDTIAAETGLPTDDVVRNGPDQFYAAIAARIVKSQPRVIASARAGSSSVPSPGAVGNTSR